MTPMNYKRTLLMLLVFGIAASTRFLAQEKPSPKLLLQVDETVSGPYGGQKSSSCLRVYSDGKVFSASRWNSPATIVDKESGKESRPEEATAFNFQLEEGDTWELSTFIESKAVRGLSKAFPPPHRPIDYFELINVHIFHEKAGEQTIVTREFFVADLGEKARYPSALIVLMNRIDEIEKDANTKGKPTIVPEDCRLQP